MSGSFILSSESPLRFPWLRACMHYSSAYALKTNKPSWLIPRKLTENLELSTGSTFLLKPLKKLIENRIEVLRHSKPVKVMIEL